MEAEPARNLLYPDYKYRLRIPLIASVMVFIIASSCSFFAYYKIGIWPPIRSDGFGYYAYLPSLFIDHNTKMATPIANRSTVVGNNPPAAAWDGIFVYDETNKILNKYTIGTAVLQTPFFVVAHLISTNTSVSLATGYSFPYQLANVVSGITYLCVGVYLLLRMLLKRFNIKISLMTLLLIVFGTNVFHYGSFDGSFSHIYSFALVAALLTVALQYENETQKQTLFWLCGAMGALIGIITITRVPNIILGIIPLCLSVQKLERSRDIKAFAAEWAIAALFFCFLITPQLVYWYTVTGHVVLNSYQREGFVNWKSPELFNFLFSIRKGLLFWSPILVITLYGFWTLCKKDKVLWYSVICVLVLHVYICSSWWNWWFGASFGSRPFVDVMPLFALPLAISIDKVSDVGARHFGVLLGATALAAMFVAVNLFIMVSYWYSYIPAGDASLESFYRLPEKWIPSLKAVEIYGADVPGAIWHENEEGWSGVWTRRGGTNVFDAKWTNGSRSVTAEIIITKAGSTIRAERISSSDGNNFTYIGTIRGSKVSGRFPGGSWEATVE